MTNTANSQPNNLEPTPATTADGVPITEDRQQRVSQALTLFSVAAWVTGIWLLILTG